MDVCAALKLWLVEEHLLPAFGVFVFPLRHVVTCDGLPRFVASLHQPPLDEWIELPDGDLDVDDVLSTQTRDGGRADVVDPQCQLSEDLLQRGLDPLELFRPLRIIFADDDHSDLSPRLP